MVQVKNRKSHQSTWRFRRAIPRPVPRRGSKSSFLEGRGKNRINLRRRPPSCRRVIRQTLENYQLEQPVLIGERPYISVLMAATSV
jgi:hypothetical protein